MRQTGTFEAKNTLGSLLDRVEKGEEIVITRQGQPVARLIRETGTSSRDQIRAAVADILEQGRQASLDGLNIQDIVSEGRR
ncbi:type II toxin-antitoxin system prevent-host-death family antitoxin [Afifella sp. JA880]|uniref:type II toxin-antitoxin system Phd/YefM family antitoxin n=1 Tax=Afifella sp. JA880 TaxID=2975280 RepID=UPI0021BAE8DB|nr:type II toxin-antitoxin system prevent-host-death family antitoxin [Afifella sp. JA880]MCT8268392.1 type II toxin-antitoxin system prevent-host-death family antitoxin [Afifella sp. JA880]